jgi:hypothetical protein
MQPSRRQFVTASLAGVPLLVSGSVVASQLPGGAQVAPAAADPVLDHITATLRELVAEGEAIPAARKGAARGIEATLGVLAAHLETHYDPQLKQALQQHVTRVGRSALVDDVVRFARERKHDTVTHEMIERAVSAFEQRGLAGFVRDGRRAVREVRLRAPEGAARVAAMPAQFDYCADLKWMIELTNWVATLVCALAILEPTPGGEIACGTIMLFLGSLQALVWWFC